MVRLGRAMSETRAGWLVISGVQNASLFSRALDPGLALPFRSASSASRSASFIGAHSKSNTPSILIDFLPSIDNVGVS